MAAARLDLASVFLYAGSIAPGWVKLSDGTEKDITIIDSFEAVGAVKAGKMSLEDAKRIECAFAPARAPAAACTPRTRWRASPRRSGCRCPAAPSPAAADRRRDYFAHRSGEAVVGMLHRGHHRAATSSPGTPSRTRSPSRWRSAAPRTSCSTSSRSRARPRSNSPSTTSTASATRFRTSPT